MRCPFLRVFAVVFVIEMLLSTAATAQMKGYFRDAGNDSQDVSLVQLIANPEKYDGKRVRFIGFLRIEFEGDAIYFHREDYDRGLSRNALWVHIPSDMKNTEKSATDKHYVICVGVFRANGHGHMGLFSGEVSDVRRIQVWPHGDSEQ